ncbi:uncharacterized protein SCHCODRAFT_02551905 [Schizophyllum commune H4-8]|nr:uncharacterized protein SCHCODRAFT_02551905 [Schizophyllum commune H4-8]KAI5888728.1 hypothetical protein SCHCODRAFT_02551905 [Schizophyllum commune H4-8]
MRTPRAYHTPASTCLFDRVPTEILEHIVLDACAGYPLDVPPKWKQGRRKRRHPYPALAVSSVCVKWRAVALTNPDIWTPYTIDVRLDDCEPRRFANEEAYVRVKAQCLGLLGCYFERSGTAPLDIHLDGIVLDEPGDWEDTVGEIVRLACSTAHRWKSCYIGGFVATYLSTLPETSALPFPLLENMTVREEEGCHMYLQLSLGGAPRLRSYVGPINPEATIMPWGQLTRLTLENKVSVQYFMSVIPQCQQLEDISVSIWSNIALPMPTVPEPPVVLTRLKRAELLFDDHEVLAHVFAALTTPQLLRLRIRGCELMETEEDGVNGHLHLPVWPVWEFDGWLRRSGESLRSLYLSDILMRREEYTALLRKLPRLSELELRRCDVPDEMFPFAIDDGILRRMVPRGREPPELLPGLTSLAIAGAFDFDYTLLLDIVQSRVALAPRMEHLELQISGESRADIDRETEAQLQKLLGDGFQCTTQGRFFMERNPQIRLSLRNRTGDTDTEPEDEDEEESEDSDF